MNPILWQPDAARVRDANLTRFVAGLPRKIDPCSDAGYAELHRWSVEDRDQFWLAVWKHSNVIGELGTTILHGGQHFLDVQWFPDSRLNFAENLLRHQNDDPAIIAFNEKNEGTFISYSTLAYESLAFADWLRSIGIQAGDRVAAVLPNISQAVVAFLGTAAIGAVWSSCSPDFGDDAICDRFAQIEPKVLLAAETTRYAGKVLNVKEKVERLRPRLTTLEHVLFTGTEFDEVTNNRRITNAFERFPFNHPLAILYSSGTTGAPKCIVHGAGGTLLQHLKEHQLHCDLKSGDRLFYYTTTGWMMWNWLVSGLASKATIVLYDGSPLHPDAETLWKLAAEEKVTHFGASAKYYAAIEKAGVKPREKFDLSALRCVMSTGSPLLPESFDYIYGDVKADVNLASISGGTDIISCFALGCPTRPVRRGELQAKGLAMDVKVFNDAGKAVIGEPGELVCTSPFPSMPVSFWNDPDNKKYRASYFERFDNVWCHGDWCEESENGGLTIFGRSDTTLNPGGVRIGTAEIYTQVEAFPEIAEALATALRGDGDEQIILFVKMKPDKELTNDLIDAIKKRLRARCSPRHVPAYLMAAPDFPRTISGKLSEIAVRNAIHDQPIKNEAALANPESLSFFRTVRETLREI